MVYFQNGQSTFNPGDPYTLVVAGKPNSDVWVTVTIMDVVSGKIGSPSSSKLGTTDGTGYFTTSGSMPNQPGAWNENYTVGGDSAGTLNFYINGTTAPPVTHTIPAALYTTPQTTIPTTPVTRVASNTPGSTAVQSNSGIPQETVSTTSGGSLPVSSGTYVPPSVVNDVWNGFSYLFKPTEWGTVFQSGNAGEIVGLLALPALVGFMFMKHNSGRERY